MCPVPTHTPFHSPHSGSSGAWSRKRHSPGTARRAQGHDQRSLDVEVAATLGSWATAQRAASRTTATATATRIAPATSRMTSTTSDSGQGATIHDDRLSSHPCSGTAGQENGRTRDVIGFAEAPEGKARRYAAFPLLRIP